MNMNDIVNKMTDVTAKSIGRLDESFTANTDIISNSQELRLDLQIIREFGKLYSAQTARAAVAVKVATALGMKKQDLLPVWTQLTGAQSEAAA